MYYDRFWHRQLPTVIEILRVDAAFETPEECPRCGSPSPAYEIRFLDSNGWEQRELGCCFNRYPIHRFAERTLQLLIASRKLERLDSGSRLAPWEQHALDALQAYFNGDKSYAEVVAVLDEADREQWEATRRYLRIYSLDGEANTKIPRVTRILGVTRNVTAAPCTRCGQTSMHVFTVGCNDGNSYRENSCCFARFPIDQIANVHLTLLTKRLEVYCENLDEAGESGCKLSDKEEEGIRVIEQYNDGMIASHEATQRLVELRFIKDPKRRRGFLR